MADADNYRLRLFRGANTSTYVVANPRFAYPAGELTEQENLEAGTWGWQVEAWKGNTLLAVGSRSTFAVLPLDDVGGMRAGLTGTATTSAPCDMSLRDEEVSVDCAELEQTPTIRWDPVDGASAYRVQVTLDRERTTLAPGDLDQEFWTTEPMWAWDEQLPDSQAGSAYFVSVRACKALNLLTCEAPEHAQHAFDKKSNGVELVAPLSQPGRVASRSDDVTFEWTDFLQTNEADEDPDRPSLGAMSYEVTLSADEAFTTRPIATAVVDQTTYTEPETTLPEGPVFWRVRAIDGSGNTLPWSEVGRFEKRSPVPNLTFPMSGGRMDGGQAFTWRALGFAKAYEVEVSNSSDPEDPVLEGITRETVYTPTKPLPAGTGYTWRLRRVDASGRKGEWTTPAPFTVTEAVPALMRPSASADVAPSGALFTWDPLPRASRYKFETRAVGTTKVTDDLTTFATALAPTWTLQAGAQEWRIVALDTELKRLGASEWRSYSVQSRPTAKPPVVPTQVGVGDTIRVDRPDWSLPEVQTTVQWYRGASAISGATELAYQVTSGDRQARTLKAVFTGVRAGWAAGSATTEQITVGDGPAPSLTSTLVVEGSAKIGSRLSVQPVTWDMPGVVTSYQWKRNGRALPSETASSYDVQGAEGDVVVVEVTGEIPGHAPGKATSAPVPVVLGDAPTVISDPRILGDPEVGEILTARNGEWSMDDLDFDHEWLRDGRPIPGQTGGTYRLSADDAGRGISVRVTADRAGFTQGSATSTSRKVARLASTTEADPSTTRLRRGRTVTVDVEVDPVGSTRPVPTGRLTLLADGRKVATGSLVQGEARLRFRPTAPGKDKLVVKYVGDSQVLPSASRAVTLTVTR